MFRKKSVEKPTNAATKATITDTAPCQKSLRLHVGHEVILPVRTAVLAQFQWEATLPGFRKGKAPADLIERQYAKDIQDETLHRVTQQAIEQAAKAHALKPVGPFEINKADFSEQDGLSLEATVEVEPAFSLAAYKGIPLTQPSVEITAEERQRALTALQESMTQLVPAQAPPATAVGGVPPKAAIGGAPASPATDVAAGRQTGEAAKERQRPPLDDELAKDLGFATLAELTSHVEAKLLEQKRTAQRQAMEQALCEELLARHAFEVPPRLVSHQTAQLTRDFKARLVLSGVPEEKLEEETAKFTSELRTSATRHVKLTFILERIAASESIGVTQDELVQRLWQLARRWRKDPAEVRASLDTQGLWPSVVSAIRREKAMAFLMSSAHIEDDSKNS